MYVTSYVTDLLLLVIDFNYPNFIETTTKLVTTAILLIKGQVKTTTKVVFSIAFVGSV